MIKAEELRIGNVVSFKGILYLIFEKCQDTFSLHNNPLRIVEVSRMDGEDKYLMPIPLTTEILEATDNISKTDEVGGGFYIIYEVEYKNSFFRFSFDKSENKLYYETGKKRNKKYFVTCKYLHQLQNLYYALTGEELTINLKQTA